MKLSASLLTGVILCGCNNANLGDAFLAHRDGGHAIAAIRQASATELVGPLYYKSDPDDLPPYPPFVDTTTTNHNDDDDASTSSSSTTTPPPRRPRRSFLHQLDRFLTILQNTSSHLKKHTFLSGNFAPVSEEHVQVPVKVVEGELPAGLDGAFCRNGPNPIISQQKKRYHWVSIVVRFDFDLIGYSECIVSLNNFSSCSATTFLSLV